MVWIVLRAKTRKTHLLTLSLYLLNSLKIKTSPLLKICLTSLKFFPWCIYLHLSLFSKTINVQYCEKECLLFICWNSCCWVKSVVFLFHFDSPWFFLLMTKNPLSQWNKYFWNSSQSFPYHLHLRTRKLNF